MEQSDDGLRILGSVTVGGRTISSPLEATLLAVLAVHVNQRVDSSTITDALWDPATDGDLSNARNIAVSRLRKRLLNAGLGKPVVSEHGGYRLALDPALIDLQRLHRADLRNPDEVRAALAEWRGDPFGGCIIGSLLEAERLRARERRLRLLVRHTEELVAEGELDLAVEAVVALREEHPADEGVAYLSMTTLYRAGRQVDALAVFDALRRHLADEYGLDPSRDLVQLHRRLLAHDSALAGARPVVERTRAVGRDDLVRDLVARVDPDRPGEIVVVLGEAGIGKSTVLAAAVAGVTDRASVGRGAWDEHGNPLTGWREALAPLGLGLASGQGPLVRDGLAALAEDGPVVVALDDVHLADSASLGVLGHLARVGLPAGVLVLAAGRSPDLRARPGWDAALADLRRRSGVAVMVLGQLDEVDARTLAARRLAGAHGSAAAERLAADAVEVASGHPLHLVTLLDLLAATPDEAIARGRLVAAPRVLAPLFVEHLAVLEPPVRRTVEALAVLEPVDLASLAATVGRELVAVADELDRAARGGVLTAFPGEYRVRHALVAAAIRETLSPAYVAALHHARWSLPDDGSDAFTRLRHALGAAALLEPSVVASAQAEAGRVAYRRGALLEAIDLLDAAREHLPPGPAVRNEVYRGLTLAATARRAEADDVLDAAVDALVADGDTDLAVLAAVGDQRLGAVAAGDGRRMARLHRIAHLLLSRAARMDVLIATVTEEARTLGRPRPESAAAHDAALADIREDDDPVLVARLRLVEALRAVEAPVPAHRRLAVSVGARAAALRTGDPLRVLEATELVLGAALAAGERDQVHSLIEELDREGLRRHRPRSRWVARLARSAVAQAEGRDDEAEQLADDAATYGGTFDIPDAPGARLVHRMVRQLLRDELGELADLVSHVAATYPHIPGWTAARAAALAQRGDLEQAREALAVYRDRRSAVGPGTTDRAGLVLAAATAHVCADVPTAMLVREALPADPTAAVVVGVGAAVYGPVTWATGLAAATLGDLPTAKHDLDLAEAMAARCGWSAWQGAASRAFDSVGGRAAGS